MTILRPFQEDFRARFHAATARRILGVAPTGSGKTVMAAAIIKDMAAQFKKVLVLAHRREIVRQTSEKLDRHGVIQAGFPLSPCNLYLRVNWTDRAE